MKFTEIIFLFLLLLILSCTQRPESTEKTNSSEIKEKEIPTLDYSLIAKFPHDTSSFTEGFLCYDNQLFESTGSPENFPQLKSIFGIVDLKTGKINKKGQLNEIYFGEGISILKNKLYQLTYKHKIGFIYNAKTYKPLGQFNFASEEGWGMTTDGTEIIMSDGTDTLSFLDPETLITKKKIAITNNGYPENNLNELEYINGYIYANIWTKNYVVKIDPKTGEVVALLDLSSLTDAAKKKNPNAEVLNGIAFDPVSNKIYVTGKLWPEIYQIDFIH